MCMCMCPLISSLSGFDRSHAPFLRSAGGIECDTSVMSGIGGSMFPFGEHDLVMIYLIEISLAFFPTAL